jgi:site-specific DNA recombinase
VPPIVEKELFYKVQLAIQNNSKFSSRNTKDESLLSCLMRCTCGSSRVLDGVGKSRYYRCSERLYKHPLPRSCFEGGINQQVADTIVWKELETLLSNPELIRKQFSRFTNKEDVLDNTQELAELDELKSEEKRSTTAYVKGSMSEQMYEEEMERIKKRRSVLEKDVSKIASSRSSLSDIDPDRIVEGVTNELKNLDMSGKQFVVRKLVDKIEATQKEITVWGHLPVPELASVSSQKVGLHAEHRHRWPAKRWQVHLI